MEQRQEQIIAGAFVKEPLVGGHNWVMSFDLNSLYPHIIMQYNISPEKLVKGNRQDVNIDRLCCRRNVIYRIANKPIHVSRPNGVLFSRDKQGMFPELINFLRRA